MKLHNENQPQAAADRAESDPEPGCKVCPLRLKAEARPNSLLARFWRWHTGWCPGWKAYQEYLRTHPQ